MFLIQCLQRKRKDFPPTYLYLVGNFPTLVPSKEVLALDFPQMLDP